MLRYGLLLSFTAVFLQIAVFLQPLLPPQYQVAPVCETIARALLLKPANDTSHTSQSHAHHDTNHYATMQMNQHGSHEHDANHQCQYCTVYGNLVLPPELDLKEVFDRLQVRLLAFQKAFTHVWFVLQQLFLIPQGRAPPVFA